MTKVPRILIYGEAANGTRYLLHDLEKENSKVQTSPEWALSTRITMLRLVAENLAHRYRKYLPNDKVSVVESLD